MKKSFIIILLANLLILNSCKKDQDFDLEAKGEESLINKGDIENVNGEIKDFGISPINPFFVSYSLSA